MSKCKAVLDGEKITSIKVKTKAQPKTSSGKSESKVSDKPKQVPATVTQQSK